MYPLKLDRKNLSKLLYFSDGVYFQHHGEMLTKERYIRLENTPQMIKQNEILMEMVRDQIIIVEPDFTNLGPNLDRFHFRILTYEEINLEREERRIINKVLKAFKKGIDDESKQYPNLYENYLVTPIFQEIPFNKHRINTKIQIHKKKSLLNLSGKIFRVLFET
jgi:hypothetical protein